MLDYEKIAEGIRMPESMSAPKEPERPLRSDGAPPADPIPEVSLAAPAQTEEIDPDQQAAHNASLAPKFEQVFYPVNHPKYQGLAAAKGYNQNTVRLQTVHYSHEAMIDVIIADPTITGGEIAAKFGRSRPWISRILGSDAFQASLAKRREELTDPFLIATMEERFRGLAMQSIDILADKLAATESADMAIKALEVSSKALGFGARQVGPGNVQNFAVYLPPKIDGEANWADAHRPGGKLIEQGAS